MDARLHPEALQAQLDDFVARVHAETRIPGIALGVSVAGRRLYAAAGSASAEAALPVSGESRFDLGCAGKLLLAIAALELEQRGALDLESTIGAHLPELRGTLHGEHVKLTHLLSHASGYRGTNVLDARTRSWGWAELVAHVGAAEPHFTPGSVFSYEHTEAVLLAEILSRVTAEPVDCLLDDYVMTPLGLDPAESPIHADPSRSAGRHAFDASANRFGAPLDGPALSPLWRAAFTARTVSIADLLAIGDALVPDAPASPRVAADASTGDVRGRDARGRDGRVARTAPLASETRRRVRAPVVRLPPAAGGPLRELLPVAFGLGAAELRDGWHGNTGVSAGQCVGLRFDVRTGATIAVGLNAMAPYVRDYALGAIASHLSGRVERDAPEPFRFDLADLEGEYAGPGQGVVECVHADGRLRCTIGRERDAAALQAELALDGEGQPRLHSPLPHLSLGFFRTSGGELALMLGLSAYKRRSTKRPFQRNGSPPERDRTI